MAEKICNCYGMILLVLAILCSQPECVHAQSKYSYNNKFHYKNGKYHFKKGWVLSGSFNVSPIAPILLASDFFLGLSRTRPRQAEYLAYYRVKPKIGLGLSLSYTKHPTMRLGYEYFSHYKFTDVGIYGKFYLDNERVRTFVDIKLGYGIANDDPIQFSCYDCSETLYIKYSSGPMFQPGFGYEFSSSSILKWGLKLSHSFNYITQERDRYPEHWEETPEGIIRSDTYGKRIGSFFFGIYFYL